MLSLDLYPDLCLPLKMLCSVRPSAEVLDGCIASNRYMVVPAISAIDAQAG